jgi:uncharacterized protein (DUF924 family)
MDTQAILAFWFGTLDAHGMADAQHVERWWRKDPAFDTQITARFLGVYQALRSGPEHSPGSAEQRLAMVLVLDQFPRNMFRGDARSFAADAQALALARAGVARAEDEMLHGHPRVFLYMPFMHSEALADQDECLRLFTRFRDQSEGALRAALDSNVRFAERHREIIARFGRFPHRNQLLERESSAEERAFLAQPGSSF